MTDAAARHPLVASTVALALAAPVMALLGRWISGSWAGGARFVVVGALAGGLSAFWQFGNSPVATRRHRLRSQREGRTTAQGLQVGVEVHGTTMFEARSRTYAALYRPNPASTPPSEMFPESARGRFDVVVRAEPAGEVARRSFDTWRQALGARDRLVAGLERGRLGAEDRQRIRTLLDLV